ncbi:hypothetical protein HMPREF9120_02647 [Neisseria sp. oral taxon 020 str. F0370]|nr:hypothetical protein HMPREF9120_02647 [Neisseria sp. oral taxon 020 str. F0370]
MAISPRPHGKRPSENPETGFRRPFCQPPTVFSLRSLNLRFQKRHVRAGRNGLSGFRLI